MKKRLFLIYLLFVCLQNFSQKNINLIVFAPGGEKFYLLLNDVKNNLKPENNVRVDNVGSGTYNVNIVFDGNIPEIKDKIYTIWENKPTNNKEFTYVVEKKGSGYRIRFLSAEDIADLSDTTKKTSAPAYADTTKKRECNNPMSDKDFDVAAQSVGSRNVEDSRIKAAKGFLEKYCLNTMQIKEICSMLEYDASRLDFIKYAYDFCTDKSNYKVLMDALDYKNSRKEFDEWLQTK